MVYVRLFESTEYLDYWQAKENVVCYKNKVFVTQSSAFRLKKDRNTVEKPFFFSLKKKVTTLKWELLKKAMMCLFYFRRRNERVFHSITTSCIKMFLGMHIERKKKVYFVRLRFFFLATTEAEV